VTILDDDSTSTSADYLHHGSHNQLLSEIAIGRAGPATANLDAILVPTAWPVDALRESMRVARATGTLLVTLCSKAADADLATKLAAAEGVDILAVDVHRAWASLLPSFSTDRLLARHGFAGDSDLSLKRNLGLFLAHGAGWRRILFLDDDIQITRPAELGRTAKLLDDYRAVGLGNLGFPDNSVVCHAYRAIGEPQDSFIGGGAMLVDTHEVRSFFPNVYNEDWFFLLGDGRDDGEPPFRAARAGEMRQREYDPFADPQRAAGEELGDTLAEGLFWLLDNKRALDQADPEFWAESLYRRRQLLDLVLLRLDACVADERQRARIRASLEAARGRSAFVTAYLCVEFVASWLEDLAEWRSFLAGMPRMNSVDKFLSEIGMWHRVKRVCPTAR
jgi:hypothetical protein